MNAHAIQCQRILRVLQAAGGGWVSLPTIMQPPDGLGKIAQYNARIHRLRHKEGYAIRNKTERIDGVRHSWYRLSIPQQSELFRLPTLSIDKTNEAGIAAQGEVPVPTKGLVATGINEAVRQ